MAQGIQTRHTRSCCSGRGRKSNCKLSFRAGTYSPRYGEKPRKAFRSLAEARSWRTDAKRSVDQGTHRSIGHS